MKREAVEEFVSPVVEGIIAGTDMELVDVGLCARTRLVFASISTKPGGCRIWMIVSW